MTAKTYDGEKVQKETKATSLLQRFSTQVARLENSVSAIEALGHRMKNTNYPKDSDAVKAAMVKEEEGFFTDLSALISRFENLNYRLDETGKKLSELI